MLLNKTTKKKVLPYENPPQFCWDPWSDFRDPNWDLQLLEVQRTCCLHQPCPLWGIWFLTCPPVRKVKVSNRQKNWEKSRRIFLWHRNVHLLKCASGRPAWHCLPPIFATCVSTTPWCSWEKRFNQYCPPPGAPEREYSINFFHLLVLLRENISINIVHPIMLQISSNIAQVRNIFSDSFPESSICQTKHILDGIW